VEPSRRDTSPGKKMPWLSRDQAKMLMKKQRAVSVNSSQLPHIVKGRTFVHSSAP
jgi:hypothetical protein